MISRLPRLVVRLSAWLTPADWRARWREEWLAESDRAIDDGRSMIGVTWRTLGAPIDALVLRWRHSTLPSVRWLAGAAGDLRFAFRLLRRQPLFGVAVWMTLALGIGGTTAIYAVVYSVLLRPLPVTDEASLVVGYVTQRGIRDTAEASWPQYEDWRGSGVFAALGAYTHERVTTALDDGTTRSLTAAGVSPNFFEVVGTQAALGRVLGPADVNASVTPAAVSDAFWREHLGSDPAVLGRVIRLGERQVTVVGVMPPGFHRWMREVHVWIPVDVVEPPDVLASRGYWLFRPIGRLKPGATLEDTATALDSFDRLHGDRARSEDRAERYGVRLSFLRDEILPAQTRQVLTVLMGAVFLTWLVVCANVSNLVLARGNVRAPELAMRRALGADGLRLRRQLLVEGAALAIPGGLLGLLVALAGVPLAIRLVPAGFLPPDIVWVDTPILVFGAAILVATALVLGLAPGIWISRSIREASSDRTASSRGRLQQAVLIGQFCVSVVVLVGAFLLLASLDRMRRVDLGFDTSGVVSMQVALPEDTYGRLESTLDPRYLPAQHALLERVRAIPGVESATLGSPIFLAGWEGRSSVHLEDGRAFLNGNEDDQDYAPGLLFVGPEYFRLHGVTVRRGRELDDDDDFGGVRSLLINEAMAAAIWPDEDPIGKRVNFGYYRPATGFDEPWAEVIGVVPDLRHGGVDVAPRPIMYRPILQYPFRTFDVVVRSNLPVRTLRSQVRDAVHGFDGGIDVLEPRPLELALADSRATIVYSSRVLSAFGVVTALLSATGVYALLAYAVARRRRELGIRLALGAAPSRLARDVGRQILWVLVPGVALGLVAAAWASRSLQALLYDIEPTDVGSFGLATAVVIATAVVAAIVPARRAARVDPVEALRT